MSREELLKKVTDIVVYQLGVPHERATPTAHIIDDLGADSMECIEIIMGLEEEFCVEIPEEDAEKLMTINAAVDYLVFKGF